MALADLSQELEVLFMPSAVALCSRAIPIAASLAILLLCANCAVSGGVKAPEKLPSGPSALPSGHRIGGVAVSLDQQKLPTEVAQVAEQYQVTHILDNRLREQLSARGIAGAGALEVEVAVIGMRLRSNGSAVWWGVMAGADWITVDVNVVDKGQSIKRFQTGTSTALGGAAFGGRSTRVGRMMKTLAERIADGI